MAGCITVGFGSLERQPQLVRIGAANCGFVLPVVAKVTAGMGKQFVNSFRVCLVLFNVLFQKVNELLFWCSQVVLQ